MDLCDLLLEVGSISTWSPAILEKIINLKKFKVTETDISTLLIKIVMTASHPLSISKMDLQFLLKEQLQDVPEQPQQWNIETLLSVLLSRNTKISLPRVIKNLDSPEFEIRDYQGVSIISTAFTFMSSKIPAGFPVSTLLEKWQNTKAQFSLVVAVVRFMPDIFIQSKSVTRYIFPPELLANKLGPQALVRSPWNIADLIACLVKLFSTEIASDVLAFIESSCLSSPELLLLGLAQIPVEELSGLADIVLKLTQVFIAGHPSSSFVVPKLWDTSPNILISGMVRVYASDVYSLSRILDISQELKALPRILEAKPYFFAIDLASLASRRDFLNLEKWLQDHIRLEGQDFLKACLQFLHDKVVAAISRNDKSFSGKPSIPLSSEVIGTFTRILATHQSLMSPEENDLLAKLSSAGQQMLRAPLPANLSPEDPSSTTLFTKEIEDESNLLFEKLYKREIAVPDLLVLLQKSQQKDNDLAKCMIQNLFDEYKYFGQYPEKELIITAQLFGSLIQNDILVGNLLAIGLRGVLEALKQNPDATLFKFGLQSLLQFQTRLAEWPQFISLLIQIENLKQVHPELYATLERLEKQGASKPKDTTVANTSAQPEIFTSIRHDTLGARENEDIPDEKTQDKILFIINNISTENIQQKMSEMKFVIDQNTFLWFSKYLVEKRVCLEPNFHQLYIDFISGLGIKELEASVLHETFKGIKNLLNSDRILTLSSDRVVLKNLAGWLGGLTLAKNKPIKHVNIGFKELLLEGYDHNRLSVAIPFVCKVLEQVQKSRIFKPPNPWLMGIMKVLAEMYHFAELKLNLKFEIEVLCKAIAMDIKEITPTSFLRERPVKGAHGLSLGIQKLSIQTTETQQGNELIGNIIPFIIFNPNFPQISSNVATRKLVIGAITKAIEEILSPVVERSVTIAGIATKELVIKDFALESDEGKMRQAAHRMVQSLAGSLASVTCREPLRIGIIQNFRSGLLQQGFTEQTLPDQAIFIIVSDNLDLACGVIEKTASEKAIEEVDKNLMNAFEARKKHRERSSQPFYDMAVYTSSRYPSTLPESLRLRPGGVSAQQIRVYEDFVRLNRADIQERSNRLYRSDLKTEGQSTALDESYPFSLSVTIEKLVQIISDLDKAIDAAISSGGSIIENEEVQKVIKKMRVLAVQSVNRDDATLLIAQKCVGIMFGTEKQEYRQVYGATLEKVLELSSKSTKEVNAWFVYSIDERRYNVDVYKVLLENGVLIVSELDIQLGRLLDIGKEVALNFVCQLLDTLLLNETPLFTLTDFFITIDMLKRIARSRSVPECVLLTVERIGKKSNVSLITDDQTGLRKQFSLLFEEWIRIYSHPASNEMIQSAFIQQLLVQGVLQADDISSLFYRVCSELSVEKYLASSAVQNVPVAVSFVPIDSFARFIILLIKLTPESTQGANSRINLVTKILSIHLLVMVNNHEENKFNFNQKPFFRFFTSLLNNLHAQQEALKLVFFQILTALSNTFHTAQPLFLPAFTFSWLQLISHRYFMSKILQVEDRKGWLFFQRLMVDLFKFMAPYIKSAEFSDSIRYLYRGTLRVLLVLLHDFPEFLCSYHFSFMDILPLNCIQMRNLILSAFPAGMRLPDPFTPNLKVDTLPEIHQPPVIHSDYIIALTPFKNELDSFLKTRQPAQFLQELVPKLFSKKSDSRYNIPAINALVLYSGLGCLSNLQTKMGTQGGPLLVGTTISIEIYNCLLSEMDDEGRYIVLSAMANQLRYPNSHTHFFSCVLFHLFLESNLLIVKEQITRVLLERLIVNRPHPYGLLITFIELIRNPKYKFWEHTSFIRCAPEIERCALLRFLCNYNRLFSSVSKSINSSFAG